MRFVARWPPKCYAQQKQAQCVREACDAPKPHVEKGAELPAQPTALSESLWLYKLRIYNEADLLCQKLLKTDGSLKAHNAGCATRATDKY